MTSNKDLKRRIRARMEKTGEAYTTARTHLLKQPARGRPAPRTATATPAPDYAKLAGMADEKVLAKTGRTWEEWVRVLDSHDATTMTHRDIAQLVSATYGTPDWWTQMVTVGYERIRGVRAIGQRRDGTYEASKSRTYSVPVTKLWDAWATSAKRKRWLDETGLTVRTSNKPKSMRLAFGDGSVVIVGFTPKGRSKSAVAVQHTRLPDRTAADGIKRYWSEKLDALEITLTTRS